MRQIPTAGRRQGSLRRRDAVHEGLTPPREPMPPVPPPRSDWRSEVTGLSALNVIAGIWLIIAPWVLGYSARDPRWNDVVFGAIVAILALARATGAYREEGLSWINAAIGVWIFIAAFTIDHTAVAAWNDIILGIIVFLFAAGSADASASRFARRRGTAPPLGR